MESRGNLPEAFCYNVLLEAYSDLEQTKDAMDVFRQIQTAGCVLNPMTYTILLKLFGRQGRYDELRELFLEMKVSSMGLDAGTYNILIDVFGKGGYYKEVITLFNDMVDGNIEPNMETYEGLIVSRMGECGVSGNNDSFIGVIEAFRQEGPFEDAIKAYVDMEKGKCFPDK